MPGEIRSRTLADTLKSVISAASRAGVTRVGDVTGFAVPGIWVYQATRPASCTLAVSQGKGLSQGAAIISAILEAVELWSAENVRPRGRPRPLSDLDDEHIELWAGERGDGHISLDREKPRSWLGARDLLSGRAYLAPRDLLAFDPPGLYGEYTANTVGLAAGNTRTEALVSGVAELLEHCAIAQFGTVSVSERRKQQIALDTITDPILRRLMRRISNAGFELRAWSMTTGLELAVMQCTMFSRSQPGDEMLPVTGNGCHPDARVAFLRALLEAVQTQATLVAGARDDMSPYEYRQGGELLVDLLLGSFAFGDGRLAWDAVPHYPQDSSVACLDHLLGKADELGSGPVIAYDHDNGLEALHFAHVLAPGLVNDLRLNAHAPMSPERTAAGDGPCIPRSGDGPDRRRILFAGPSVHGLAIPPGIELRPPAVCGDFAELLDSPPLAVALVDGCFKTAPTVWHREILDLIAVGTTVIGGASLGALRAAELDRFGMIGVGEIYHAYRAGALVRDDAVMLDHAPAQLGYAPLTIALVDAEHVLLQADLPPAALRMMQRIVRTTAYEHRDWHSCLARYRARTGENFPLTLAELENAPSLKQADALKSIAALENCEARTGALPDPPAITSHYRAVLARRAPAFLAARS